MNEDYFMFIKNQMKVNDEIYENFDSLRDYCCFLRNGIVASMVANLALLIGLAILASKI